MKCRLCPRKCNAQRTANENNTGFCGMPLLPRVARAALHFWEEPCISGKNGSGTVFFSGCPLKCIYCQNYQISKENSGTDITVKQLSEIFRRLEGQGANNINLVTPTHYVTAIREALDIYRPNIPIIYNSGGYDSVGALKSLEGYIDIFLMDFKYMSDFKAEEYSNAGDYPKIAKAALRECYQQQPESVISKDGIMQKGVIVRHLLLPRSTEDAIRVYDWVRENLPNGYFSLMSQYIPLGQAKEHPVIGRRITRREYDKVVNYICGYDFENVYIQDPESSDEKYIPEFNGEGVIG